MHYKIIYRKKRYPTIQAMVICAVLLLVGVYLGTERLEVLEQLAQQLSAGETIGEVVSALCQDVIYGS